MAQVTGYGEALRASVLVLALAACGCSHWPWHKPPPPAPQPVHYLGVGGEGAAAVRGQYWKRNTLLVDLTGASGSGSITLRAPEEGWPVRLALRVTPGAVGELDVRGAQRMVLPIAPGGVKPVELELPPALYTVKTAEMSVSWGPAAAPAG
ncbi:MAG TPA: hypothetical protein VMT66_11710 [Steroidobacteraceae bacterium]|nr:hypothetical protein [Steroidobacteraceae bacterium]